MSGLMPSTEAVGRGEAVSARDDVDGDEAARIRERLVLLAAEREIIPKMVMIFWDVSVPKTM